MVKHIKVPINFENSQNSYRYGNGEGNGNGYGYERQIIF